MSDADVRAAVKEKYGEAALRVKTRGNPCCGSNANVCADPITSNLYDDAQASQVPEEALIASLGCGIRRLWRI
jgi:arsenite methyltransferase